MADAAPESELSDCGGITDRRLLMMVLGGAAIVDAGTAPRDLREAERLASAD